jgi:serine/threonine protein kinase
MIAGSTMLSTELAIPGYEALAPVELRHGCTSFVARRTHDDESVILKVARFDATTSRHLASLRNEKEIGDVLALDGVVHPLALETTSTYLALVLENPEASPLERLCGQPFAVTRFLKIAIPIASTLSAFHSLDVVHKDIKPHNILVDDNETRI